MHEAAIAQSIVETVLCEAEKQNAEKITSVEIEIGELTFLGIEQIEFWVRTGFEGTPAAGAEILFRRIPGKLLCCDCGYEGVLKLIEDPVYHLRLPAFSCPDCSGNHIEITEGKEALIRRIHI